MKSVHVLLRMNRLPRCRLMAAKFSTNEISKEAILSKSLQYVGEYGWSDECLVKAVQDLQLPPLSHRIVTRGAPEIVQFVLQKKLEHVSTSMSALYNDKPLQQDEPDYDRLRSAVESHMTYLLPYQNKWAEALAISMTPSELPTTAQSVFQLSDDLCHYGGIRATRLDWYYERAVVAALYTATELFFLTDTSENCQDTRMFLERNLENYQMARKSPFAIQNLFWKMTMK